MASPENKIHDPRLEIGVDCAVSGGETLREYSPRVAVEITNKQPSAGCETERTGRRESEKQREGEYMGRRSGENEKRKMREREREEWEEKGRRGEPREKSSSRSGA